MADPYSIDDQQKEIYRRYQAQQEQFADTPAEEEEQDTEHLDNQFGELAHQEMENHAEKSTGLLSQIGDFAKHIPIGVAKGVEETLQTVRVLDDNAFNLPEPTTIGGSLGQGIGQFLPLFGVGGWAIKGGLKLANLFQKSQKLTKAGAALTAVGAGALSDFAAFDPKDANMGNLALTIGAISNDPRTAGAVKKYLAQQDEDSELTARSKNALTGMVAGVITEGLLRGTGYALKKTGVVKPKPKDAPTTTKDDILEEPIEDSLEEVDELKGDVADEDGPVIKDQDVDESELEPGVLDIAKDFADILDSMKKTPDGAAMIKGSFKEVPDAELGAAAKLQKTADDPILAWEKMEAESPSITRAITEAINTHMNGGDIPFQDMTVTIKEGRRKGDVVPIIETMNFLKMDTPEEAQQFLQFVSSKLDTPDIRKPRVTDEDLELQSVIPELLDQFIDTTDADAVADSIAQISKAASNIDDAIRYVGTSKIMAQISYRKVIDAAKKDAAEGTEESARAFVQHQLVLENVLRAGGLLSKKSSDLLRSFKGKRALDNEDLLTAELLRVIQKTPKKLTVKKSKSHAILEAQDEVSAKVFAENQPTQKVKATKAETKTGKKHQKQITRLGGAKKLLNKIKALKNKLRSEKSPERGAPFGRDAKGNKKPEVDSPEVRSLKAQIKKVKEERSSLEVKNNKIFKKQLKLRRRFEKISDDIKKLREGQEPTKGTKAKPESTVDINKLVAERTRLKKEFNTDNKAQIAIDAKSKKLNNLLMKRIGKGQKEGHIDPREISTLEKELDDAIARENTKIKERVTREELEETLISKGTRQTNKEVTDMTLRQLKTRVQSLNKSFLAKTGNAWMEMYINGLLSSVKTFGAVNPFGNVSAIMTNIVERTFAGATGDQIAMREAGILAWESLSGIPEAFKTFMSAMKTGPKDLDVKLDFSDPRTRHISKEAFNVGGNLGKLIDIMGSVVNLPGKILLSQDEAFKGLTFRAEQKALAYRKARNKFNDADPNIGNVQVKIKEEYDNIVRDLEAHPDIVEAAKQQAAKNTFTNPLHDIIETDPRTGKDRVVPGLSKRVQGTLDRHGWMRVFVPFFRTPVNILNHTWERTPILQFANGNLRRELTSSDAAVKQLAYAKVGTSTAIWGGLFSMAMSGNFTGAPPRDPNERKAQEAATGGRPWNSVYIFGGWRKYDRLDPYGMQLAAAANMATMAKSMLHLRGRFEEEGDPSGLIRQKYEEMIHASIIGTVEMMKDRHYLQGISELIDAVSGDERHLSQSIKRVATFADPRISFYSSIRRGLTRGLSPEKQRRLQRDVGLPEESEGLHSMGGIIDELNLSWEEALRDVTPGHGKVLPQKNLAGEVVSNPGLGQEFSTLDNLVTSMTNPSPSLNPSKSPLIHKLAELNSDTAQPSSIRKMGNVVLTDEEKTFVIDEWTSLNKRILEPMVKNKNFLNSPEGIQKLILENTIRANKRAAQKLALAKFDRLKKGYGQYLVQDAHQKIIEEQPQQSSLVPIGN